MCPIANTLGGMDAAVEKREQSLAKKSSGRFRRKWRSAELCNYCLCEP